MPSDNVLSADNQQERRQISPWYISGFVDGEGSFHIAIYKDPRMKTCIKVIPEIHVSQNRSSQKVLEEIRDYFHCGYIKANHRGSISDRTNVFVVRDRNDLVQHIIPFFEKYPLRTNKAKDFQIFAKVVRMIVNGDHRSPLGIRKIISLAYKMNEKGKRRKVKESDLIKFVESSETICETLTEDVRKDIVRTV